MDAGYDTSFDFSRTVNGDITLYAKWTEKPRHTISMSDMTGGYVFAPDEAYEGQEVRIYPHDDLGYDLEYIGCMTDGDETDLESGWYAVVDSVTNSERISNNGNTQDGVNLILCDGAILTNPKGMSVNGGRSLTVWGQSEGTGTWNITKPPLSCAGIGGYINTSGDITINGGAKGISVQNSNNTNR